MAKEKYTFNFLGTIKVESNRIIHGAINEERLAMGTQHYAALQIHYPPEPFDVGGGKTMMSWDHWETIAVFDLGKDYTLASWIYKHYKSVGRPHEEHDMSADDWPDESYDQCNYKMGTTVPDPETWKKLDREFCDIPGEAQEMWPPLRCLVAGFNTLPEGRRRILWWTDQ